MQGILVPSSVSKGDQQAYDAFRAGMIRITEPFACRYSVAVIEERFGHMKIELRNDVIHLKVDFTFTRDELLTLSPNELAYPLLRRYEKAHKEWCVEVTEPNIELGEN